jgi:hypothetical protein
MFSFVNMSLFEEVVVRDLVSLPVFFLTNSRSNGGFLPMWN